MNGFPFTPLFNFAPDEVCRSGSVAAAEVGSYPAVSPFPDPENPDTRRFVFCCAVCKKVFTPSPRALPGIVPCGVRTFLPVRRLPNRAIAWFIAYSSNSIPALSSSSSSSSYSSSSRSSRSERLPVSSLSKYVSPSSPLSSKNNMREQ